MIKSVLTKNQKKTFSKVFKENGRNYIIYATVRYDDECGNGHNSFSITGEIWKATESGQKTGRDLEAGGCIHDEVAKHFPHLAHAVPFHLCSSDEPMHYTANTVYLAGNRDHNGLLKGEFKQFKNKAGVLRWTTKSIPHMPDVFAETCPNKFYIVKYIPDGITGSGKAAELDHARSSAIWPDATDEDLTAPGLANRLAARLLDLMKRFKEVVEGLGFTY
jgi:hypothetical protein